MIDEVIGLVLLAGGGYGVFKFMQKVQKNVESDFYTLIRCSAARWLAPRLNVSEKEVEGALERWIQENQPPLLLKNIIRLEFEVTKGAKECVLKIIVLLKENDKVTFGEVEQKIDWEYLPQGIRKEFIRSGKSAQAFVFVEVQSEG